MKKFTAAIFGTKEIDTKHIGVLDGIRALSVIFVVGFHFWQQSWLWNLKDDKIFAWIPKALNAIGVQNVSLNWLFQHGYVFVDMMIFLTGLCLFLPYATSMLEKQKLPHPGKFYLKRVARIFPSYYLCILIFAVFLVGPASYGGDVKAYFADLFTHLTFTQMFTKSTYLNTQFNGVLWTMTVEMLFYIIFPLLAYLFTKAPLVTYLSMNCVSLIYFLTIIPRKEDMSFYVNRFPSFMCVFANGMMTALLIAAMAKNLKQNKYTGLLFTGMAIFSLYIFRIVIKYSLGTAQNGQFWQVQNRFLLSLIFSTFIIGSTFSFNWFRAIFSNPAARFFSAISFNLYIWHQTIAIKLRENKIPYYVSESGWPGRDAGRAWQWKYTLICWAVSIGVAALITYLVEKPLHKLILGGFRKKKPVPAPAVEEVAEAPREQEDYFIEVNGEAGEYNRDGDAVLDEEMRVSDISTNSETGDQL